jgi:hypothetical protein
VVLETPFGSGEEAHKEWRDAPPQHRAAVLERIKAVRADKARKGQRRLPEQPPKQKPGVLERLSGLPPNKNEPKKGLDNAPLGKPAVFDRLDCQPPQRKSALEQLEGTPTAAGRKQPVLERVGAPKATMAERLEEPLRNLDLSERLGAPPSKLGSKRAISERLGGTSAVEGACQLPGTGSLDITPPGDDKEGAPQKRAKKYDRVASPGETDDEVELTPAADSEDEEEGGPSEAEEEGTGGDLSGTRE